MKNLFRYGIAIAILVTCAAAPELRAQGSRKDDVIINAQGRPLAGATVRVCTANSTGQPCAPLANLYSNQTLTQALANPLTTDGLGNYVFYAAPGRYTIEVSGPGLIAKQFQNVILPNDPSDPSFTSLTLSGNLTVTGSAAIGGILTANGVGGSVSAKSSAYTLVATDSWVNVTGTTTITVPRSIVGSRWVVFNSGSNTVTVQPDAGTINGAANITLSANTGREITCDGTNCFAH